MFRGIFKPLYFFPHCNDDHVQYIKSQSSRSEIGSQKPKMKKTVWT